MSVRPAHDAAVRVTVSSHELLYDLRWYDDSESIVPLWWLGAWERGTDELLHTGIIQGPRSLSPRALFDWLTEAAPSSLAAHLVGAVAEAVADTRQPAS